MQYINLDYLKSNLNSLKEEWNSKKPFRYLVMDNFFYGNAAEQVLAEYPEIKDGKWDGTTYINQKNKFQKREFESDSLFNDVFSELNSSEFLTVLSQITGIENLIPDQKLFGGGLHQSIKGAFLDLHVDYNIHPETKQHRRLNALVYFNKDWKEQYEGCLELWDMDKKIQLEKILPHFNRCVIFETNEISFHGHPIPLKTPDGINRKSVATYYYTQSRPESEIVKEHNTIYVSSGGITSRMKNLSSGIKAFFERIKK